MTTEIAELRLVRIMAAVIAVGAVLFCWLALGAIALHYAYAPWGWTVFAIIAVFGAPVAAAALMPVCTLVQARIALGIAAGLYLIAAFSALVLVSPLPWSEPHWVLNNTAAATSAAALALPRSWAWSYNGIVSVIVGASHLSPLDGSGVLVGIQDGLYSFMFCAVFIALAQLTVARARRVDEETQAAGRHATVVAAAHARHAERGRIDALLHDTVLATLMLASRSGDRMDDALRRQASDAIGSLAAGVDAPSIENRVEVALADALRDRLERVDPRIEIEERHEPVHLPAAVTAALADAAAEAARNAVRHARLGDRLPAVSVSRTTGGVTVTVRDDGVGFRWEDVPASRLGLRSSVLGRVESIPGASAVVESSPGHGTTVRLGWRRP